MNVYFLGIGGIGMSALARYFKVQGHRVGGYDRTRTSLTEKMEEEEGIEINYLDEEERIGEEYRCPENTLVIYTPAIPNDCRQLIYFRSNGFTIRKRAEVLGMISREGKAICIAGTHGKTTVSTLTAFLLHRSAVGCNAFLGGISANFDSNLLLNPNSPYVVIEADEFDRSFLQLSPTFALITSMDADHLDIYQSRENMLEAFDAFAKQVVKGGTLFLKEGLCLSGVEISGYYGVETQVDCYADHLQIKEGKYLFDYHGKYGDIEQLECGMPGRLNVENATAAITLALEVGVSPEEIRVALPEFRGIARRFNVHVQNKERVYIDDYAHHPKEIEATLGSIREMWPDRLLTVVFQPHLYSRTRDFYLEFAQSLSLADQVILLDIYPARELPIPGVTSELILQHLKVPGVILSKEAFLVYVKNEFQKGILVTMGAGDIDRLVYQVKNGINKN